MVVLGPLNINYRLAYGLIILYIFLWMSTTFSKHYMNESVLDYMMPNVYRLFLNITIQHVRHRFNHGLCSTFLEFEQGIDEIFDEINVYIHQFTTKSDTLTKREKRWIFGMAIMIVSIPFGKMCNILYHTSFPIKDTINKTSCPIKSIYYHLLRLLQVISKMCVQILQT